MADSIDSEKYIDFLVNDYIDKKGFLRSQQIKRKRVAIDYWAFLLLLNGTWKVMTRKRFIDLQKQFKNMTINEICSYVNSEIMSRQLVTSNELTQKLRESFSSGRESTQGSKAVVRLNPTVQFNLGNYKLDKLPAVTIVAAEVKKEKREV